MVSELLDRWADGIASGACVIGAFACIYLMQAILRERTWLVHTQRAGLLLLGCCLFANAMSDVKVIEGRRETGILVDVAVMLLLLIMAIRGRTVMQGERHEPEKQPAEWSQG